ncbi:MAG: CCA tRNA nucleotidyltransferase, partial [SAR202 cluster bacterium]|nr:CCA tRNA nucleotidyltransferase [SAR202 cluster bacterium]
MKDLSSVLERLLSHEELAVLRRAGRAAAAHGIELYLVGGSVRDLLLGQTPADLDLAGVGVTEPFASALAHDLGGRIVSRSQFVTAHVRTNGALIDLAMARRETYAKPGALPSVSPAEDIREDLERRDFSINAMALSLSGKRWGRLLDPLDGRRDLERKRIRVLHDRSFEDDATRIFRAVRYSVRMGFALEPHTEALLRDGLRSVNTLSGERVWNELERMFLEKRAVSAVRRAKALGALDAVAPGMGLPDGGVGALPSGEERVKVLLALTAWPLAPIPGVAVVKRRLQLDRAMTKVVDDAADVKEMLSALSGSDVRPSRLHEMLSGLEPEAVKAAAIACGDPGVARLLGYYLDELRGAATVLDGGDLMDLGVPEGPRVGRLLKELLAARLDGLV